MKKERKMSVSAKTLTLSPNSKKGVIGEDISTSLPQPDSTGTFVVPNSFTAAIKATTATLKFQSARGIPSSELSIKSSSTSINTPSTLTPGGAAPYLSRSKENSPSSRPLSQAASDLPSHEPEDQGTRAQEKRSRKVGFLLAMGNNEEYRAKEDPHPSSTPGIDSESPTRKGSQSFSNRRRSRSPAGNIMREIRKMSLASQDAREEQKKSKQGGGSAGAAGGNADSLSASASSPPGNSQISSKKAAAAAKKLNRRRKRREEEYTDKDRAAAVTLGSRDIKQSLKAKKKRERKLRISIDLLHSEDFLSAMLVVEAAYQMRVKKQTTAALSTLNKALELQPTHKAALVARSQCHLKLGDAASALRDAQTSFDGNDTYIMGLYQYAEALYNLGQFEKALIAYHRGYRIRKLENFRIGIQKSQEAIRRAIGDRSATQIEDLDEILPLIDELEASATLRRDPTAGASPTTTTAGATIPIESEPGAAAPSSHTAPTNNTNNNNAGGAPAPTTMMSGEGGGRRMGSRHTRTPAQTSQSRARWVAREVLGQMYFDKDYLTKFLLRPDIQSDQGASQELRSNATEALNYLEIREQFWRQQNPMYARKQGLNLNNKMVLQCEEQERERQDANRRNTKDDPSKAAASKATATTTPSNITSTQHGSSDKENLPGGSSKGKLSKTTTNKATTAPATTTTSAPVGAPNKKSKASSTQGKKESPLAPIPVLNVESSNNSGGSNQAKREQLGSAKR